MNKERVHQHQYLRPHILIVDDDIDSALKVETIFHYLGCQTTCALSWNEARKKMCATKPDIIIMDWLLDHEVNAAQVIKHCSKTFAKFDKQPNSQTRSRTQNRPQVITYSSLTDAEITVPQTPYYDHLDHWQKPIPQRELLVRALGLLNKLHR